MPAGPSRRTLIAIIGGLVAIVVTLSILLVDSAIDRSAVEANEAQSTRTINALTKQLYWAEQQLDECERAR